VFGADDAARRAEPLDLFYNNFHYFWQIFSRLDLSEKHRGETFSNSPLKPFIIYL